MKGVGAVPVRRLLKPPIPPGGIALPGPKGWAAPGALAFLTRARLVGAVHVLAANELAAVEDRLVELLALADLCAEAPSPPSPPSGPVDYPRFGDVHWIRGQETGGEDKRYVVVSHDHHNAAGNRPLVVRLTSRDKSRFEDFPRLRDGSGHACPGELFAAPTDVIVTRDRPEPSRVDFEDSVAMARAVVSTHALEDAVLRAGGADLRP
jgi:hypothetical protein